ncbi:choice-of-anchor Q domain-containing protein [Niabella drilacis]|uniref:Right handed beta helix region n=1 Tax=Niabella drilacis (strain DSM 25811 / CCM 8410 / CCUG 62505 / LMG 26954 / E90) TaxID=1285928 RepID=A0A1G6MTF5_NIADE|nr:choice-of-anchor Q domain-containing protein [Niabella drilacis]SDC58497.1 hypothetical protein SAMN04487894_10322 [Niabella drilacis]
MELFAYHFTIVQAAVPLPLQRTPGVKLLLAFALLFLGFTGNAQTPDANGIVYVKSGAAGNGAGWGEALSELATALKAAKTNTGIKEIWVAKGTYKPLFSPEDGPLFGTNQGRDNAFLLPKDVKVYGGFDPDNGRATFETRSAKQAVTILSGDIDNNMLLDYGNACHIVVSAGNAGSAVLDGFTVTGGYAFGNNRGSINVNSINVSGTAGGGISLAHSSPVLSDLIITGNSAIYGGGIAHETASPLIINVLIANNQCTDAMDYTSRAGGMYNSSAASPTLVNVTIIGNSASLGGGIYNRYADILIRNSIIYGNSANAGQGMQNEASTPAVSYSLIQGSQDTSNGNLSASGISAAQLFNNAGAGDYTLKAGSVAVNAGDNALYPGLGNGSKDLAGNARVYALGNGGVIDMGAYESPYTPVRPDVNGIVYVKTEATGNGNSWANATGDLQAAIDATGTQQVWVAKGEYRVTGSSFILKNGVKVYGGFDPARGIDDLTKSRILPAASGGASGNGSILNGRNDRPVIFNDFIFTTRIDNTAALDGFTLTGGYSAANGAGIYNSYASPVLRNLVIEGNLADNNGGGMYNNNSSPVITNVVIRGNTAKNGGGMLNLNSSPVLTNVSITRNTAGSAGGGLVQAAGLVVLNNVTVAGNTTNAVVIQNGALAANNAIIYGGVDLMSGGTMTPVHSLIQGNTDFTNGNINAADIAATDVFTDPAGGDYTLKNGAPAIDKGSDSLYPGLNAATRDLAGKPRLTGSTIDMGAYEYDAALPVRFGSFSAVIRDDQLLVSWSTESETDNDHFKIQVSQDGMQWSTVQTVQSRAVTGNSSAVLEYNSVIPLSAAMTSAGLLLLAFGTAGTCGRRKKCRALCTVIGCALLFSCHKGDLFGSPEAGRLFVRIVQVDKGGKEQVSKVIRTTAE